MATWNGERFIGEQLESIARQSHPPMELVVSDDGSSDRTLEIVDAFADRAPFEVVVLRNDKRLGYGDNFFRAMAACGGDLIALCDQDDVWAEHKLALCAEPFRADPGVSLVAHAARVCDESLHPLGWLNPKIEKRRLLEPGALPPFAGFSAFALVLRALFVRGAEPERRPAGFFDGEGDRIEHGVWANLVCGALGSIALIPEHLALYRRHGANTSVIGRDGAMRRARRSLTLRTEGVAFGEAARAVEERRIYLESLRGLADDLGRHASDGLDRAIRSHRLYASAMERRASAYAKPGRADRAARILLHALGGDYGRRAKGGLGTASLARDMTVGTLYRR